MRITNELLAPSMNLSSDSKDRSNDIQKLQTAKRPGSIKRFSNWLATNQNTSRESSTKSNTQTITIYADVDDFNISPDENNTTSRAVKAENNISDQTNVADDSNPTQTPRKLPVRSDKSLPEPPFHVLCNKKKRQLVYLICSASILSPLSASLYFPSLVQISIDFGIDTEHVLLSSAIYMAVQGLVPVLWMVYGEDLARRPTMVITLILFMSSNVGLALVKGFTSLMVLRALQAGAGAVLPSIGYSIITDISISEERNQLANLFGQIMISTFISPILGGVLTNDMSSRSIFWFLLTTGTIVLIMVVFILPETQRIIVGNGSIRLKRYQQPLIPHLFISSTETSLISERDNLSVATQTVTTRAFFEPLRCLQQKEVVVATLYGGFVFAICSTVVATLAPLLEQHYLLTPILIGFAFLPAGSGSLFSFLFIQKLILHDLRATEDNYKFRKDIPVEQHLDKKLLPDFPIERARLRSTWWLTIIFIAATAGYGFSFLSGKIALPLLLQFFITLTGTTLLLLNGVLVADVNTVGRTSVTAPMNMVRLLMGALAVGVVQLLLERIGMGFTFLVMAMIAVVVSPFMLLYWVNGRCWRPIGEVWENMVGSMPTFRLLEIDIRSVLLWAKKSREILSRVKIGVAMDWIKFRRTPKVDEVEILRVRNSISVDNSN